MENETIVENVTYPIDINKVFRHILIEKPRVTRFTIDWGVSNQCVQLSEPDEGQMDVCEEKIPEEIKTEVTSSEKHPVQQKNIEVIEISDDSSSESEEFFYL